MRRVHTGALRESGSAVLVVFVIVVEGEINMVRLRVGCVLQGREGGSVGAGSHGGVRKRARRMAGAVFSNSDSCLVSS